LHCSNPVSPRRGRHLDGHGFGRHLHVPFAAHALLTNGATSPVDPGDGNPQEPEEDLSVSVSMSVPEPFALTQGAAVTIPLAVSGNTTDVTYEAAADAMMPGLSVDSSTGEVTGTPSGATGTVYKIAVVASGTARPSPRIA